MAFKELADLDCEVTTALGGLNKRTNKPNPTSIEGYYIGSRKVPSKKSSTGFANIYVFQTAEGNVGVWGKTNLDSKMSNVTPGHLTRVTYVGMQETKNNPMYKYKVEVDSENTIEVAAANSGASDEGDDESYSGYDSDDEEEPEPPSRGAGSRQAAARSFLAGGRKGLGE